MRMAGWREGTGIVSESQDLRARLTAAIDAIPIVDTHEHIPDESVILNRESSFFDFFEHYVSSDLVSAGLPRAVLETMRDRSNNLSLKGRWNILAPYWPYVRVTGYGLAMREYMRDLFGVDDVTEDTLLDLCERIRRAHQPGWYRTVLKDKARIVTALVTRWPGQHVKVDREFFRAVPILDHFATPTTRADITALESESGCSIHSLEDLARGMETRLVQFVKDGIVAIKVFLAYSRTLQFDRVTGVEASRSFTRLFLSEPGFLTFADRKPMQDHMVRRLLGLAKDHNLPVQVHTGLQEGNGNFLEHSKPTLLTNLFMEFPGVRFDLFHAGYPFTGEVAVLAKGFPNVFADLCWVHAMSPRVAARTLGDWLELIPANKVLAAGGDSNYVEGAYGHCKIARRIAVQVLADKVESGDLSEDEAVWLGQQVLRANAVHLFALNDLN